MTFDSVRRIQEYQAKGHLPFPTLRDPRRAGYERFGIERKGVRELLSPGTVWYYLKRLLQGRVPAVGHSDYYQMGGDVLLDADSSVLWVYRSRNPADRPSVDDILKRIDERVGRPGV